MTSTVDDPVLALLQHINFLKRCSQVPTKSTGIWTDDIDEPQCEHHGLHPGLFASLPVELVGSDLDDPNGCIECGTLFNVNQVVISLSCGHRMHHECARAWFTEHACCPKLNCGKAFETPSILERKELEPARDSFPTVTKALMTILGPNLRRAEVEYDGLASQDATASLRTHKGILQVVFDAETGEIHSESGVSHEDFARLVGRFYQGSIIVRARVEKPPRAPEEKLDLPAPLTICLVNPDSGTKDKVPPPKNKYLEKTRNVLKRFNSGANPLAGKGATASLAGPIVTIASSTCSIRRRFPKVRSSGRLLPLSKAMTCGDEEAEEEDPQEQVCQENLLATPTVEMSPPPSSPISSSSTCGQVWKRSPTACDKHAIFGFQKVFSFTVKGGILYQQNSFQNAARACQGRTLDPSPRTLYL